MSGPPTHYMEGILVYCPECGPVAVGRSEGNLEVCQYKNIMMQMNVVEMVLDFTCDCGEKVALSLGKITEPMGKLKNLKGY